jgi:hypothetical protein
MPAPVAVDFDGVIHAQPRGWLDGSVYGDPLPGALDGLRSLMADYPVFIFTSRNAPQVATWLARYDFAVSTDDSSLTHDRDWNGKIWDVRGVLLVTNRKLGAQVYIDDRGVRFSDWEQALADVKRYAR